MLPFPLLPLTFAALAAALPLPMVDAHRVETLVRIDVRSGLVSTIDALLDNAPFLGALRPDVVPDAEGVTDEGARSLYVVRHRQIAPDILQLTVSGPDAKVTLEVSRSLLDALARLVPDDRQMMRERLEVAEHRADELAAEIRALEARATALRVRARGLDPTSWLATLRTRLAKLMDERWDLALDIAVDEGLRKHLAQRLAALSEFVERQGPDVSNPEWNEVMEQVALARGELEILRNAKDATPQAVEELRRRLNGLEAKLVSTPKVAPGPTRRERNPEWLQTRNQLGNAEFELAQQSARLAAVEQMVERLTEEVMQFQEIADGLTDVSQELHQLRQHAANNQQALLSLRDQEIQRNRPVLTLISGPTAFAGR